jgi:hypothetical protein
MAVTIVNVKFITLTVTSFFPPIIKYCLQIGVIRGWGGLHVATLCPSLELGMLYAWVPCFHQTIQLHTMLLHQRKYKRISSE